MTGCERPLLRPWGLLTVKNHAGAGSSRQHKAWLINGHGLRPPLPHCPAHRMPRRSLGPRSVRPAATSCSPGPSHHRSAPRSCLVGPSGRQRKHYVFSPPCSIYVMNTGRSIGSAEPWLLISRQLSLAGFVGDDDIPAAKHGISDLIVKRPRRSSLPARDSGFIVTTAVGSFRDNVSLEPALVDARSQRGLAGALHSCAQGDYSSVGHKPELADFDAVTNEIKCGPRPCAHRTPPRQMTFSPRVPSVHLCLGKASIASIVAPGSRVQSHTGAISRYSSPRRLKERRSEELPVRLSDFRRFQTRSRRSGWMSSSPRRTTRLGDAP